MHLARMSNAVDRCFRVARPDQDPDRYLDELRTIAVSERVDLVVPVSEESMHVAALRDTLAETNRRREIQASFNREHGITPETVVKQISSLRDSIWEADYVTVPMEQDRPEPEIPIHEIPALLEGLRREMAEAAKDLEFERAAELRDRIRALESERLGTT